jgi:predicted patatin/cPLA2 family phospholipase
VTLPARPAAGYAFGDSGVLSLMLARRAAGSRPGRRSDGQRLALVIEGGGMRGVYVGGMAKALGDLGLRDSIDEIYAVSAGAFVGAGLVTGRTERLARTYYEDLAGPPFVSFPRLMAGQGPLVSLAFLLDTVMVGRYGFDLSALIGSDIALRAVATSLETLSAGVLTDLATAQEWRSALHASATIPVWAGPPVELHGQRWIDGCVTDPLPIARAIRDGASHVLALLSRGPQERGSPTGRVNAAMRPQLDRMQPGLAAAMGRRGRLHAEASRLVLVRARSDGVQVMGLRPVRGYGIRVLSSDPHRLRLAGEAGEAAVHAAVAAAQPAATSP